MKLARKDRSLLAWMLFFSILFSALSCASGHGQMVGMQLSGDDGEHSSHHHGGGSDAASAHAAADTGCAFASPFGAIVLAAFFGLIGLLPVDNPRPLPALSIPRQVRYRWPPANPRASPGLFPVL